MKASPTPSPERLNHKNTIDADPFDLLIINPTQATRIDLTHRPIDATAPLINQTPTSQGVGTVTPSFAEQHLGGDDEEER